MYSIRICPALDCFIKGFSRLARHSVHGFCRVSLGLWKILVRLLWVHISVFFDDFVAAEIEPLAKLCDMAVSMAFSLLGWTTSSDKENPFGSIAKVLGLKINY